MSKTPTNFAESLRAELDRAGMTAYELANRTGLSHGSMSRLLSGKQLPGWWAVVQIALALDISLDVLRTPDIQLGVSPPVRPPRQNISKKMQN